MLLSCHVSPAVCTVYPGYHRSANVHQAAGRKCSMKCVVPQEEDLRLQTLPLCTCSPLYQFDFMGNT